MCLQRAVRNISCFRKCASLLVALETDSKGFKKKKNWNHMNRSLSKPTMCLSFLAERGKNPAVFRLSSIFHNFLKLCLQQSWIILLGKPALFWKMWPFSKRNNQICVESTLNWTKPSIFHCFLGERQSNLLRSWTTQ